MALELWDGGAIDGWNLLQAGAWTYSLNNTCDTAPALSSLQPSTVTEDLGAESDERGTFLPYKPIVFTDRMPPTANGANGVGCQLTYTLTGPDDMPVRQRCCRHAFLAGLVYNVRSQM